MSEFLRDITEYARELPTPLLVVAAVLFPLTYFATYLDDGWLGVIGLTVGLAVSCAIGAAFGWYRSGLPEATDE